MPIDGSACLEECFKVPTKLAIGIKATVEKGEEEGKSWTPRT